MLGNVRDGDRIVERYTGLSSVWALTEFREEPLVAEKKSLTPSPTPSPMRSFAPPPDVWEVVRDRKLDAVLTNQTAGTLWDLAYPIQALSLSEEGSELCPTGDEPWWVNIFIQRENLGFSISPFNEGMTEEISLGGVGEPRASPFTRPSPRTIEYRIQGWSFGARLTGTLGMVSATVDGTVAQNAEFQWRNGNQRAGGRKWLSCSPCSLGRARDRTGRRRVYPETKPGELRGPRFRAFFEWFPPHDVHRLLATTLSAFVGALFACLVGPTYRSKSWLRASRGPALLRRR